MAMGAVTGEAGAIDIGAIDVTKLKDAVALGNEVQYRIENADTKKLLTTAVKVLDLRMALQNSWYARLSKVVAEMDESNIHSAGALEALQCRQEHAHAFFMERLFRALDESEMAGIVGYLEIEKIFSEPLVRAIELTVDLKAPCSVAAAGVARAMLDLREATIDRNWNIINQLVAAAVESANSAGLSDFKGQNLSHATKRSVTIWSYTSESGMSNRGR